MSQRRSDARVPRTVLERKIWERNETLAEFVDYAERFARKAGEPGTLSERNLKRLVAGQKTDGSPIGRPRPATARLLERIFGISVGELLSPADNARVDTEHELRQRLAASRHVDGPILSVFQHQLNAIRRLDRELGAIIAHDEVVTKIRQLGRLQSHSLAPQNCRRLSGILAELLTLAGWQALDLGNMTEAWQHYERAKAAANESGLAELGAHAAAEQAIVLLDLGETTAAVQLLDEARRTARKASPALRSWLAAACGEALAKDNQRAASLRSFDRASELLPEGTHSTERPYVALNAVHLARWRGHALAHSGAPEAVDVLRSALSHLDRTFIRAEAGLRVDLATAFANEGEHREAAAHAERALSLIDTVGSVRQRRRLHTCLPLTVS